MENSTSQNQANPTGIWESMWLQLITDVIANLQQRNYFQAWQSLQLLEVVLPPEDVLPEVKPKFEVIRELMKKQFRGYTLDEVTEKKNQHFYQVLPKPEFELLGAITASLFKNHWINKNFEVQPRSKTNVHIRG